MPSLDILEKIGLSKAEIKVYYSLLGLGTVSSGKIVTETEFHKSTVYDSLRRLEEKGLVAYIIKEGIKYFEATEPERILDFIRDIKRKLIAHEDEAKILIQKLKKEVPRIKPIAEARILVGIEGYKTVRREALRYANKQPIMIIGGMSKDSEIMPGFFKDWNKQRQRLAIPIKILHKESARGKGMTKKEVMGKLFQTRFLPENIENPAAISIFGDHVVNVVWHQDRPLCFILMNKEIAASYRSYFDYLWKMAK